MSDPHHPVLLYQAQVHLHATLFCRIVANLADLRVQRRLDNFTVVNLDDQVRIAFAENDQQLLRLPVPLAADKDAVAIVERLRAGDNQRNFTLGKPPMRSNGAVICFCFIANCVSYAMC